MRIKNIFKKNKKLITKNEKVFSPHAKTQPTVLFALS